MYRITKGNLLGNKDAFIADIESVIVDYQQELRQQIITTHKPEELSREEGRSFESYLQFS